MKTEAASLPLSPHAGRFLADAYGELQAHSRTLLQEWRSKFHPHPKPSARALYALEQLLLPGQFSGESVNESALLELAHYTASRLAKLGVPWRHVSEAFEAFRPLAAQQLQGGLDQDADAVAIVAMMEGVQQKLSLTAAQAYLELESAARGALLAVLDAELRSASLEDLLHRLLGQAAELFPIRWGEILLAESGDTPESGGRRRRRRLVHRAWYGVDTRDAQPDAMAGPLYSRVLNSGTAGFLLDASTDPRAAQPYFRALGVKSVWAAPLAPRDSNNTANVLGVLAVSFDRVYECLPQERELLCALAERSALAIERTRLIDSLRRERNRVWELSQRVIAAQEEECRRIGRDLHDETGQTLLALRLSLEMGLRENPSPAVRDALSRALSLADRGVGELRRVLAQLSPMVLEEFGLESALNQELRRLGSIYKWNTSFRYRIDRPIPHSLATQIYRLVQEGLANIARHAHATEVRLTAVTAHGEICLRLSDDGIGMSDPAAGSATFGHFGLSGMRERLRLVGGRLQIGTAHGRGVKLDMYLPMPPTMHPNSSAVPLAAIGPAEGAGSQ